MRFPLPDGSQIPWPARTIISQGNQDMVWDWSINLSKSFVTARHSPLANLVG